MDDPLPVRIRHSPAPGGYLTGKALPTTLIAHYLQTTTEAVQAPLPLAAPADRCEAEYRGAGEHGPANNLSGGG